MIAQSCGRTKLWLQDSCTKVSWTRRLPSLSPLLVCLVVFLAQAPAYGTDGLVFKATTIECTAAGGDAATSAVFEFTNQSTRPVNIKGIRTSCGCVEAKADATQFETGQEGRISVVIQPSSKKLPQQKSIIVQTDEPTTPRIILLLRMNAPETVSAKAKPVLP